MQINTASASMRAPNVPTLWARWSDPSTWASWDPDVRSVDFDGPFVNGATGVIVPASGPKVSFTLADVCEGQSFTTVAKVPGSTVRFRHVVDVDGEAATVTHTVEMDGWTTALLGRLIGPRLAPKLADAVANVAAADVDITS